MAIEIVMPKFGWTMETGVLAEWNKHDGDRVAVGDVLFTVESDKALNEVESFEAGILRLPPDAPGPGATVAVGALLAYIVQPGEPAPFEAAEQTLSAVAGGFIPPDPTGAPAPSGRSHPNPPPHASTVAGGLISPGPPGTPAGSAGTAPRPARHKISPRARRAADELGVDLAALSGTGSGGRIIERDVRAAAARLPQATAAPSAAARPTPALLAAEWAAPVTLTTEADAAELVHLLAVLEQDAASSALPLPTLADLLLKIAAHALREHPRLNSRLEGDEIVEPDGVHLAVTIETEQASAAPVIRDAHAKPLRQIAQERLALNEQARAGQLPPEAVQGATFLLADLGAHGVDAFTPRLGPLSCAALGLGRLTPKLVVTDEARGQTAVRPMLFLSLTFDHRLVDGAPAARFLQRLTQLMQQPYLWLAG